MHGYTMNAWESAVCTLTGNSVQPDWIYVCIMINAIYHIEYFIILRLTVVNHGTKKSRMCDHVCELFT